MDATRTNALRAELLRQRDRMALRRQSERDALRGATGERAEVGDEADRSSLDLLTDIDGALLQIRAETLDHIDSALDQIDQRTASARAVVVTSHLRDCAPFRLQCDAGPVRKRANRRWRAPANR